MCKLVKRLLKWHKHTPKGMEDGRAGRDESVRNVDEWYCE